MKNTKKSTFSLNQFSIVIATLIVVQGCSSLESSGEMGASVRTMISEQIDNPNAVMEAKAVEARGLDGQLGEKVLKTYRQDVAKPAAVNNEIHINVGS